MVENPMWILLFDIVILLAGCLVLGGLFARWGRQSPLVGYLLAGMLLGGPGSLQVVQSAKEIEAIAELGVTLLLFSLGLEFSMERLRRLGLRATVGGVTQVVVTLALGAGVAMLFGRSVPEAVAVGAMVSLSSTAVVLRLLMDRAEVDTLHGRNCVAVLLSQDLAVVPLAVLITLLGGGGTDVYMQLGRTLALACGLVLLLYVLINKLAVAALGALTLDANRELSIVLAMVTGLGSAWAAHAVGLSPALGAFVAGMFLGSSPFATQIRADVSSLRVVLLTLFFGAAGMVADPVWIFQHWYLVLALTLLLVAGKTAITWGLFRALGDAAPVAAASGLCLAQIGEFAFVLGKVGQQAGVVSGETYLVLVSVTIVTLVLSPYLVPAAPRLGTRLANLWPGTAGPPYAPTADAALHPDIVVLGFGPAGQVAAQAFVGSTLRVLVVDLNAEGVRRARAQGLQAHVGDATQFDVLEHAHIRSAKAVVITIPHHESALRILETVRTIAPHAHTVVRSRYQRHTRLFVAAGAHAVVGDEEESGASLGRHLSTWLEGRTRDDTPNPARAEETA